MEVRSAPRPTEDHHAGAVERGWDLVTHPGRAIHTTETKHAFKTSEFMGFILRLVGILVIAAVVSADGELADSFLARDAWLDVTIISGAYMIGRGLAKAGTVEHHGPPVPWAEPDPVDAHDPLERLEGETAQGA